MKKKELFVTLLVFLSGFCSLIYQAVWDRLARINFGGDNISVTIVLSVFLLGLGVGAYLFRKIKKDPIKVYGLVEITTGLFAIFSYSYISNLALLINSFYHPGIQDISGVRLLSIAGCITFLLPPCVLMGGTLPLMFNSFINNENYSSKKVGIFYGFNTVGAMTGALCVPFVFLNNISISSTLIIVGTLNVCIGILFLLIWRYKLFSKKVNTIPSPEATVLKIEKDKGNENILYFLIVSFITGLVTVGFEISLTRHSFMLISSSPYNLTFILVPVLLSISIGSLTIPYFFEKKNNLDSHFKVGLLLILGMTGVIISILLSQLLLTNFNFLPKLENVFLTMTYYFALSGPTFFIFGGIFPVLCKASSSSSSELPDKTGTIYLTNSIGAFTGALFIHFFAFKYFGTKLSILLMILFGTIVGIKLMFKSKGRWPLLETTPLFLFIILAQYFNSWNPYISGNIIGNTEEVSQIEGETGVATISWNHDKTHGELFVSGQGMGKIPEEPKTIKQVSAILATSQKKKILVLGLGAGGYIRELIKDKSIASIDIVDWSYELPILFQRKDVVEVLGETLGDERVRVHRGDARVAVGLYSNNEFDIILDNLCYPTWVGATGIRSEYYFKEISRILKHSGSYFLTTNYARWRSNILKGLSLNFDYVYENEKIHIVSSRKKPLSMDDRLIKEVVKKYNEKISLTYNTFTEGYKLLNKIELKNETPIIDNELFSEYYLQFSEIFEQLSLRNF